MSNTVVHASVAESKLRDIRDRARGDTEADHAEADAVLVTLLRQLGYRDVADLFESIGKWYA